MLGSIMKDYVTANVKAITDPMSVVRAQMEQRTRPLRNTPGVDINDPLGQHTMGELRTAAASRGITGRWAMNKPTLIKALHDAGVNDL